MIPALFFMTSMHAVCMRSTITMTSMGDIRNDIEFTRRLLDENRFAAKVATERLFKLSVRPGNSVKEHVLLQRSLVNLSRKEDELRDELGRLLLVVLQEQMKQA